MGAFPLPHPLDRAVLLGVERAAEAESLLQARREARESMGEEDESDSKISFTGSVTVFRNPDDTLYGMVYTSWVGKNGKDDIETTSSRIKVPITEE